MSRPLRIEFPGAWYHVMNRGRRSEPIFHQHSDYQMFLELLKQSKELWNINIAAYCLMTHHYHILIQTPDANISRAMRHINSIYTQRFNKKHGFDGPLFRGRFKSVLVCDDSHLLELVRYIHKNPVRASRVTDMADYRWSSHKGYLSYAKTWNWIEKDLIFSMLTPKKKGRLKAFIEFMEQDDSERIKRFFSLKQLPSLLGPERFTTKIRKEFYFKKKSREIPESKQLAPTPNIILEEVCHYYNVTPDELRITRRGWFNRPRNVAIYLIRMLCAKKLTDIS
ncbi:MAG: transposase, partial [Desulfobulbaceae bacterium]|nr:transposase [Desulfobulbaceae bacterium]